tara:strand:- start:327 stop:743 length:417 start_codon:yes stop_codon:yes gene_type:complete
MVTFRNNNNNRRNNFRRNDRGYKSGSDRSKYSSNFTNSENFQRKVPGRNNHNASKLIEKYNDLAREALSVGDKIMSENYFQHADHFTRIMNEKENYKKNKSEENLNSNNGSDSSIPKKTDLSSEKKTEGLEKPQTDVV